MTKKGRLMENIIRHGEELFADGKIEEAENCFLDLLSKDSKQAEILNNLGVIDYSKGNVKQAIDYFKKALEIDPFYKQAVINWATLLKNSNLFYESIPYLEKALVRFPNDQEISQLLKEAQLTQKTKIRIAIFCLPGSQSFLSNILDFLNSKYEVMTCFTNNRRELAAAVDWADIIWLDWANEIAIFVTNHLPLTPKKRVICRIRSYEVLSGYLPQINWSKVSRVVYVADHIQRIANEVCPSLVNQPPSLVIKNGLALGPFRFNMKEPGFNLAVVGFINHKKNPAMWIEILSRLVKIDPRYRVKVAGKLQDLRYAYYFQNIIAKLKFKGHIQFFGHVKDIPHWFEKEEINYLLSTSVFESFGYNIAEAMAMGIRPLIHGFPGAEELWPHDCLFSTTDELIEMIRDDNNYNSKAYREFVEQRYPLQIQLDKFDSLIKEISQTNDSNVSPIKLQAPQELDACVKTCASEKSISELEINHHSGVKVKLRIIPGDHMSRTLLTRSFYEQGMLEYIYQNFDQSLNFVDVGAHIGNHTVFFSVVCKANRVDSFEPNPMVRRVLEENVSINHLYNTVIHGTALGASNGNGTLEMGPWPHSGMTKVKTCESGKVVIRPLDSVVEEPVDILKIDVEGMAGEVLSGAKRLLVENRPTLFVECADEKEFDEVMDVIQPLGYRPKRRFNATPTILFEYTENAQPQKISYGQAVELTSMIQ